MGDLWSDANDYAEKMKQEREAKQAEEAKIKQAEKAALEEAKQKEQDKKEGMI